MHAQRQGRHIGLPTQQIKLGVRAAEESDDSHVVEQKGNELARLAL
jgi:hypothetical protein